jgi:hypothetical protein
MWAVWISSPVGAQSLNVDFGQVFSAPAGDYAAAGKAGVWNNFAALPSGQRFAVVGLVGQALPARIYNLGTTTMLTHDNPGTAGGDAALIDDMYLSFNNPVDACIYFENLWNGAYSVLTYAITPNDPSRLCRVRVDFGTPGPVMIGGAWPGGHQAGVTYAHHTVTVTNGTMGIHSGLFNGNIQSGINGIQIVRHADRRGDMNCDGAVNFFDIDGFLLAVFDIAAYSAMNPQCDPSNADAGADGAVDFFDIDPFLTCLFDGNCPP